MSYLPKVAVVILNWNGLVYLKKFLPSVCASTYLNLEIVVGDNASNDDSVSFIKENYPHIRVISNDYNYGFAGGYNKVLNQLDHDYFILLNSDVEVEAGWIEPVIKLMESDSKIAAAQPKILSQSNKSWQVELEMELNLNGKNALDRAKYQPKLTNNKVKITNIVL